jgi:Zn finger protein HypA/HybF involved in hydrogenase expression
MPTKYTGQWDKSKLHTMMNKGSAYAECMCCGTKIIHWTTIMSRICPKCHSYHGIDRLVSDYDNRVFNEKIRTKANNKKLRKKFTNLISALENEKVGIIRDNELVTKEEGWINFVGRFINDDFIYTARAFTCLKCDSCNFVTVIEVEPGYNIKRATGTAEASNYEIDFNCVKCGDYNKTRRVSVSYDGHSYISKFGDPISESLRDYIAPIKKKKWFSFITRS